MRNPVRVIFPLTLLALTCACGGAIDEATGELTDTSVAPLSGSVAGGTEVRIDGQAVCWDPVVSFGAKAARATRRTAEAVIVTAPAQPAGEVMMHVQCPGPVALSFDLPFLYQREVAPLSTRPVRPL